MLDAPFTRLEDESRTVLIQLGFFVADPELAAVDGVSLIKNDGA